MAADITIKNQGQGATTGDDTTIAPVIDLRVTAAPATGASSSQGAAGQGATATNPAAQAPTQTGVAANPSSVTAPATVQLSPPPKKPVGINLEDEAMMAQAQGVIAPPDKYAVPSMVKEKFPDLVQLIKETESMNEQERDYWFQILPIMTEDQIGKFRDILLNEKNQLSRLDKEYEDELNRLNQKHMLEWKEFESKEKRKALTAAESKSKEEEKAAEEELLRRLSQP